MDKNYKAIGNRHKYYKDQRKYLIKVDEWYASYQIGKKKISLTKRY